MRVWQGLEGLGQDVRYALRMMRRTPGFTAVAVLSLTLGIGANTAIFTLVNTLMLRLLPVQQPEQLVEFLQKYPGEPRHSGVFSWLSYDYFRDHSRSFAGVMAVSGPGRVPVRAEGLEPEPLYMQMVSGNFFSVLGMRPAIGRLLIPEDHSGGASGSTAAVVSWVYWKNRFNLDPGVLGKRILVRDTPATIVGVAPRAFAGLMPGLRTDVWLPRPVSGGGGGLIVLARLKPGVSLEQAHAEMTVLHQFTIEERAHDSPNPVVRQLKIELEPAGAGLAALRDRFARPLLVLMSVVGVLLLIACANIASLLLARAAARRREMAVRVSLGAGRFRLMRQVLTESLLLSAAGSLFGLLVAYFGAGALVRILLSGRRDPGLPQGLEIPVQPDLHVLLFTLGAALLTGALFGLAPAWSAFASAPALSLRETGRGGETRLRRLFGKGLVAAQVALSVALLSAAGLFVGHLINLRNLDLGFRRDHLLLVSLDTSRSGYRRDQLAIPYQQLLQRFMAIPEVRSASLSLATPISGAGASRFANVEGHPERPEDRRYLSLNWVSPKFFETLGTPLLAGRDFTFEDRGRSRVAIINQAMARHYFPDGNAVGKHLTIDSDRRTGGWYGGDDPYEIVGVVGDAKYYEIREAPPRTVYFNMFQEGQIGGQFDLRTNISPAAVAGDIRRAASEVLKTVTVENIRTMDEQVDASIVTERLVATLSGLFGAIGLLLAAIGLYGLLAYTVARRANEIGIRMALGATPADALRMVLGDALGMVCAGLAVGAPLAFWGRTLAAGLIEDVKVTSGLPIIVGAAAMVAVGLVAAYLPARRAAHVDPMEALRYE